MISQDRVLYVSTLAARQWSIVEFVDMFGWPDITVVLPEQKEKLQSERCEFFNVMKQ